MISRLIAISLLFIGSYGSLQSKGKIIFETGISYGNTFQELSEKDISEDVSDITFLIGLGTAIVPIKDWGDLEFMAHLIASKYGLDGNGGAFSPIANFLFTSKDIIGSLRTYTGFGLGLGFDFMRLVQYTNSYKWTIDLFLGMEYAVNNEISLKLGPILRHKSHSFIGPWRGPGTNVGYNEIMVSFAVRHLALINL